METGFKARATPESDELKKVADIFEALVLWHGEQSDWFGANATTMKTSRYDDYVNGVDAVIEFRGSDPGSASHVGLAADVTFTQDTTAKFDRLRGQIEKGQLPVVKYFHSENMNFHGQLSKLPEVIIGAERKAVLELAELWAERKMDKLAVHPIQIMILTQIEAQLRVFALYAESLKKPDLAKIYRARLAIIENILAQKADLVKKTKFEINDSVHSAIIGFLASWQKTLLEAKTKIA